MTDTDKIIISQLDFDQIKGSIKAYLSSQDEFVDYDFDGSGMGILLDILAYNTYYGSYYDNVVANESRLHSAALRDSIVSKAKELGYVPYSRSAPSVYLDIVVKPPNPEDAFWQDQASIEVPRGKVFSTNVDSKSYDYTTLEDFYLVQNDDKTAYITPIVGDEPVYVRAFEGKLKVASFVVDTADTDKRYIIPAVGVDKSKIRVYVKPNVDSGIDSQTEFYPAATFTIPDSDNNAFWIWENTSFQYEIEFGDGVLAKKLKTGNVVVVEYLITNGSLTNGCSTFKTSSGIAGIRGVSVTSVSQSSGGAEEESLSSIKFNAPKAYSMQNRAVTNEDYQFLIQQVYPAATSVIVWGGEDNVPPQYGKVFACIYPALDEAGKDEVKALIKQYNMITIAPEIIDPDFVTIIPDIAVIYNKALTTKNDGLIYSAVFDAVNTFSDDILEQFGHNFRYSQFVGAITDADPSIVSNLTTIRLQRQFDVDIDNPAQYELNFKDALEPATVSMTGFVYFDNAVYPDATYRVIDNGLGVIQVIRVRPNKTDVVVASVGVVDYVSGVVNLSSFAPKSIDDDSTLKMNVIPLDPDVITSQNTILSIADATITVSQGKG